MVTGKCSLMDDTRGDMLNSFFYSAAAYSQQGDYEKAVQDATKALEVDPKYSKGYSRLG